ncbi:hypothetical protein BHE74_00003560 [Ensete ventricosum]|nr:hypothetical protein BHE74_00003560 [Ensete ventricosum]
MSSSGSSNDRSVLYARSKRTQSESPEDGVSGSSSLGMPSPVDAKSLRDLKVMKSYHDIASIVTEESLGLIQARYSISKEYALRALLPEQRPYNPESFELSISVDVLEIGLWFPLHPTIVECLRWWRISPSAMDLDTLRRKSKMSCGKSSSIA